MAAACNPTTLPSAPSSKTLAKPLPQTLAKPNPSTLSFTPQSYHILTMSTSVRKPSPFLSSSSSAAAAAAAAIDDSRTRTLKSRLAAGETLYGLFLLSFSPTLAEIAGLAGYDYVVVDMEHGEGDLSSALPCLRALAAAATPTVLRLPESSAVWAKKALDLGPHGLMFPAVESSAAAASAVSYCRYPPNGVRGAAHTVARASGYGTDDGYLEHYEEGLLIMCQVESEKGVEEIEAIAAVDGVDCVQMGPLDLSASLGYLWDPGHRKVREVMVEAERRVLAGGGAYLGGFAMPHDSPEELKKRGYHMVAGAVDVGMFRKAAVEDVLKFRSAPGSRDVVAGGEEEGRDGDDKEKEYWSE